MTCGQAAASLEKVGGAEHSRQRSTDNASQFKRQDNAMGLIFRSALPEELDWNTRAEDVALSLDAIRRCLTNMLVALDRDTPQTKQGPALPT